MKDGTGSWWSGHQRRHPVSSWRWWIGQGIVLALALGFVGYKTLTREARLRHFAERWLEDFTGGEAHIDQVRFDLFNGSLHLVGVTIAAPVEAYFDPRDNSFEARTLFRSATLFLRLRPLSIITGNLAVPEIVAVNPELTLIHRMSDGLGNWAATLARRQRRPLSERRWHLPVIRLRDVRLAQYQLDERGRTGGPPQVLYAEANPFPERPEVYNLALTKLVDAPSSRDLSAETGHLEIDMRTLAVAGSLPTMTIGELLFTAPPEIMRWLNVLALRGHVRPDTFSYDPQKRGQARLSLRDASFSVPIDVQEQGLPHDQRYLRLADMAGVLEFDGRRARAALTGSFHGSAVEVNGSLTLPGDEGAGLDDLGFELELKATELPLLRQDAQADAAQVRFVRRWERLSKFVEEYDGLGNVDVVLRLRKQPGADQPVQFVEGTLKPRGASGRYYEFPYRVYDLTGVVHFRPDGWVELRDLAGTHGAGKIVITGLVGGYVSRVVKLDIQGRGITLDEDLLTCLSQADRALCRQFQAAATMDLAVHLEREEGSPGARADDWHTIIDATFTDGSAEFAGFPYPLQRLRGRMRIADGRFDIDRLCASRGQTDVCITGTAQRHVNGPARIELAITAANVALDKTLVRALSSDARRLYDQFDPTGRADITGRVFSSPRDGGIEYELTASLSGVDLTLPRTRARLTGARGTVRIGPDRLDIAPLTGRFHQANVDFQASVGMKPRDTWLSLKLASPRLPLDEALREVLPAPVQEVWDTLRPGGAAAVSLGYEQPSPPGTPASPSGLVSTSRPASASQPAGEVVPAAGYTLTIEPQEATACHAALPLPVSGITGRVVVTPGRVDLHDLVCRHQQATIALDGTIEYSGQRTRAELRVNARNVELSEPLRQAMPWRVLRVWNDVRPRGRVDLQFDPLVVTAAPAAAPAWECQLKVKMRDVALTLGSELTELDGTVSGNLALGDELTTRADLDLARLRVDGRLVAGLKAGMVRPAGDPVFRLTDVQGAFYDGTITGQVEVDYSRRSPQFGLSLAARNVSLEQFLNARRSPGQEPVRLQGTVEGNLGIVGRFGDPRSRRGGGTIFVRDAQMFKVPLLLSILQVIHLATDDDNAFHDASFSYVVDGEDLVLEEIDLRGKAFSMVGAGRVHVPDQALHLVLLVGSPLKLPRVEVLSELLEGVAREVMEVHVEGTLDQPTFRAELGRSVAKALEAALSVQRGRLQPSSRP